MTGMDSSKTFQTIYLRAYIFIWKRFFVGAILTNKNLFVGTVTINKNLFAGTTPETNDVFAWTPLVCLFFLGLVKDYLAESSHTLIKNGQNGVQKIITDSYLKFLIIFKH